VHELGLCEGVVKAVRARAGGRPVAKVVLRVGAAHAVDERSLRQAFELVAAGTEAEGASLLLTTVPIQVSCAACGAAASSTDPLAVCPSCGSAEVELAGGDELILESLTYSRASSA
jgi:hydrogenase nickel incorporation protein HypA/HybF